MSKKKGHSRLLRELAEKLIGEIAEGEDMPEQEQRDLVTSLVRQWVTYYLGNQVTQHLALGNGRCGCYAERVARAARTRYSHDDPLAGYALPQRRRP